MNIPINKKNKSDNQKRQANDAESKNKNNNVDYNINLESSQSDMDDASEQSDLSMTYKKVFEVNKDDNDMNNYELSNQESSISLNENQKLIHLNKDEFFKLSREERDDRLQNLARVLNG